MHPAASVIIFTVFSGAGFGAMALIGAGYPLSASPTIAFATMVLSGGLAVAGLLSSTFHLGHPERAWRAFSQWRSSWLSREGVLAVAALISFGAFALVRQFTDMTLDWLGWVITALCMLTVYATAMIYAQLETVPMWRSVMTPIVYLSFALTSGLLLLAGMSGQESLAIGPVPIVATGAVIIAWTVKLLWWRRAGSDLLTAGGLTRESATGLGQLGRVRLLERPHTGGNYLSREMVHRIGRKPAKKLKAIALLFGAALPLLIAVSAGIWKLDVAVMTLAFIAMMVGLFVERWLFFAEARHAVSLYYD